MHEFSQDIYTEPSNIGVNTLRNLGPLTAMTGIWQGTLGMDFSPNEKGQREQVFVERIELEPIDPQTNGPQLFYGLRYHTNVVIEGQIGTYHDQVGYWLWEPASETAIHTITIPRGQIVMAVGKASADAKEFELVATKGSDTYGICSNPFLEYAFKTTEFRIKVTSNQDGTWSYDEDTVHEVHGKFEPFHHRDRNTLTKIGEPTPNPLAQT